MTFIILYNTIWILVTLWHPVMSTLIDWLSAEQRTAIFFQLAAILLKQDRKTLFFQCHTLWWIQPVAIWDVFAVHLIRCLCAPKGKPLTGLEPATWALQKPCSTSWARVAWPHWEALSRLISRSRYHWALSNESSELLQSAACATGAAGVIQQLLEVRQPARFPP